MFKKKISKDWFKGFNAGCLAVGVGTFVSMALYFHSNRSTDDEVADETEVRENA